MPTSRIREALICAITESGNLAQVRRSLERSALPWSLLDQIDPSSIETIEVLKGPSATAIYGSDAANGVVVNHRRGYGKAGTRSNWNLMLGDCVNWQPGNWPTNYYVFGYHPVANNGTAAKLCDWFAPCVVDSVVAFQALNDPRFTVFSHGSDQTASLTVSGGVPTLQYSLTGSAAGDAGNLKLPGIEGSGAG